MPMPPYPVICYAAACPNEAVYKIAGRWSDGLTEELKTYSLSCAQCLPRLFADAKNRRDRCRLAIGETLEIPGIYLLEHGARDRQLRRMVELEKDQLKV